MATPSAATESTVDLGGSTADVDRLRVVVLRLNRRIRVTSHDGISASQRSALGTIDRHAPCTIGEIAELEHMQPPSASKVVSSLESLGYVERRTDPNDRRIALVALTPHGESLIAEIRAAGRTWLAERLGELDDADVATLSEAIPALERLLGVYCDDNNTNQPKPDVPRTDP